MRAFKPVWVLFLALCVVTIVSLASKAMAPKDIIPWRTDLAAALREAAEKGRPVFAYFTASWCVPCETLKTTTWADAKVEAALRNYVPVKIDFDARLDLATKYQVESLPTMLVLRASGEPERVLDMAVPPDDLITWLRGAPTPK